MEFGSKALYRGAAVLILLLGGAGMWGQSSSEGRVFQLEARHTRLWTDRPGTLTFDAVGIRFEQSSAGEKEEPFAASWPYEDLQELALSPEEVRLVTYEDRPWLLGRDRRFTFALSPGQDIKPLYGMLKRRMDRRFVAGIADPEAGTLWEVPVKRSGLFKGAQGVLRIGRDMIVFEANRPGESRSWRYQDIENVSSDGPYSLTLVTHERAILDYGSRRSFDFQLKRPMPDERFQWLWKRLYSARELPLLRGIAESGSQQQ